MKKKKPTVLIYNLIKLGVFLVLDVFIFIFRSPIIAEYLKFLIGGLMLLYGVEEILFEAIFAEKHFLHKSKVYLGFVEILFGFTMLFGQFELEYVCIIWATWSIIREAFEIKEIITELRFLVPKVISGIESIAIIVFSIMLLLEPGEHHAMIHLYLLLIELPFFALTPSFDELMYIWMSKKAKKEIKEEEKEKQE